MPPKKKNGVARRLRRRVADSRTITAPVAPVGSTFSAPLIAGPRVDPFPPRRSASLRYNQIDTILTTGTEFVFGTALSWTLNSLFAPISGGHQPYGFDTLAALYNRYRVRSVDMELTIMYNGGVQNSIVGGVVLPPGVSATIAASTYNIVSEKPLSFMVPIVGGTNTGTVFVKQRFDIAKISGLTRKEFEANVEDYAAVVSASPSKVAKLEIASCGVQTTTATSSKVLTTLVFHCDFWERTILAQS
jgi:hypothetical protein